MNAHRPCSCHPLMSAIAQSRQTRYRGMTEAEFAASASGTLPAWWRYPECLEIRDRVLRTTFATVRREIWSDRESRLRATWESYG